MLTENKITELLSVYLEKRGYKIKQKLNSRQHGIDLIATGTDGTDLCIEVKGETSAMETSKRFGLPFEGKQIWNHVSVAFMKTLRDMSEPINEGKNFGMAFPFNHEILATRINPYAKKLGISIFLVSEGEIKKII